MSGTSAWNAGRAEELIRRERDQRGALLPVLHALQHEFGYIDDDAVPLVAQALNLSRADVTGVVSFYRDFRTRPPGRRVVKLCRAEACQARGADALFAHLGKQGLPADGTTDDGAVTVETVYCLGNCALGPAALVDGRPLAALTPERLDRALAGDEP